MCTAIWSVGLYGPDCYFHKNTYNSDSLSSIPASNETGGSVSIQLGGL